MLEPFVVTVLALLAVWTPPDSWPIAGLFLSIVMGGILAARPSDTREDPCPAPWLVVPVLFWIVLGLLATGWDRGQGVSELAIAAIVLLVMIAAARQEPGRWNLVVFAGGISLLSVWALWQTEIGFDMARTALSSVPENIRGAVLFRLNTGRAFASQISPGHLGVLLATVVPLAGAGLARRRWRVLWTAVLFLASAGLVLTRSPLAMALAVTALLLTLEPLGRSWLRPAAAVSLVLLTIVLTRRPDLLHLDPIVWRLENWHNALWVWAGSPITGVGLGGFGQAALGVPFPVPNHPLHAHNLPLEWLAEMGLPGLALAVLFYSWLLSLARRLWPSHRGLAVALLVIPVHNLADFSLFQPGIAVAWAVLAGWATAVARGGPEEAPTPVLSRWITVPAAAAAAAFFGLSFASALLLRQAAPEPGRTGSLPAQVAAFELAPWQPLPDALARAALSVQGPPAEALARAVRKARWWRPHSASLAQTASLLAARTGDLPAAACAAWEARAFLALDRRPDSDPGATP